MTARILDGLGIAKIIQEEIKAEVDDFKKNNIYPPCLSVILASDDPASKIYVRRKQEACAKVGIRSELFYSFGNAYGRPIGKQDELEGLVRWLNQEKWCHGILVQLPLRVPLKEYPIFSLISEFKDVDVFNPVNVGLLVQGHPRLKPCTPHGIQELLYRSGISIAEKKVVVINRSCIIGRPLSSMLIQDNDEYANATVTVCHNRTPPSLLKEITLNADIIVVAVGIPGFLTADMVRKDQVVIDVGVNRLESGKIVGDVDFDPVSEVVGAISKVPGGCGPLTISMLLRNTLECAKTQRDSLV